MEDKTSVPSPSLALTEADEKKSDAVPGAFTLKAMFTRRPAEPLKPGVGNPPLNVILPIELENAGSSTHKVKIDHDLLTEITSSNEVGKLMTASALFIAVPSVSTKMLTLRILPTVRFPEEGLRLREAAYALLHPNKKIPKAKMLT